MIIELIVFSIKIKQKPHVDIAYQRAVFLNNICCNIYNCS